MTSVSGRREIFLAEMGVGPIWLRRDSSAIVEETAPIEASSAELGIVTNTDEAPVVSMRQTAVPVSASEAPSAWEDEPDTTPAIRIAGLAARAAPTAGEIAQMDWNQLKATVAACTKCDLCQSRNATVFGAGDTKATWLFVGDGPGREDESKGEPFAGPAGKLLDNMMQAIGLKRGEKTYVANVVKCRPVGADGLDRPPTPDESAACRPYLERQIALLQPAVLVALGKTASLALLKSDAATPAPTLREAVHRYAGLPLVATYHPADLLRNPADKKKAWADLCMAVDACAGSGGA